MNAEQFDKVLDRRLVLTREVLASKRKEYLYYKIGNVANRSVGRLSVKMR